MQPIYWVGLLLLTTIACVVRQTVRKKPGWLKFFFQLFWILIVPVVLFENFKEFLRQRRRDYRKKHRSQNRPL